MTAREFKLKADLSGVVQSQKIIASSIGPMGEACLLLVPVEFEKVPFGREVVTTGGAIFLLTKSPNVYPATFIRFDGEVIQRTELPGLNIMFPIVQSLPNGQVLLVGARCDCRNGDPEQNALICGSDGEVIRRFFVGDGISDVQTTREGMIWISYFDEGVYGAHESNKAVGETGLVCFDSGGRLVWEFEPPEGFDGIDGCYALNVTNDAVWICYYADFPLVKVDAERKTRAWKNSYGGANALAVDGQHVVLWGGYGSMHSPGIQQQTDDTALEDVIKLTLRCIRQRIGNDTLEDAVELAIGFPKDIDFKSVKVLGRGSTLHGFVGNLWFSWDFRAIS